MYQGRSSHIHIKLHYSSTTRCCNVAPVCFIRVQLSAKCNFEHGRTFIHKLNEYTLQFWIVDAKYPLLACCYLVFWMIGYLSRTTKDSQMSPMPCEPGQGVKTVPAAVANTGLHCRYLCKKQVTGRHTSTSKPMWRVK